MTITRISPGVWELRTRHGTLIATGDLYTIVTLWARMQPRLVCDPLRAAADARRPP
jgi:hypothetical protein